MDIDKELQKIFNDDDFGLLEVKPKICNKSTPEERLIKSFDEINKFIDDTGNIPQETGSTLERCLYYRLQNFLENNQKMQILKPYDRHNLLTIEEKAPETVDDIFNDDDFDILKDETDIFTLKNVSKSIKMPDYRGKHKPCKDFSKFEKKFVDCQQDIKNGKRSLSPFTKEQLIEEGMFFVLKGVLLYIDNVGEFKLVNGKKQSRLRVIYENATESDILNRSLARALYRDGRRVSQNTETVLDKFAGITEEDKETGYIYVLQSLSQDEQVQSVKDLYKIGYCGPDIEKRIKNAQNEPTYLMASVKIVSAFKTFNMDTQKFEHLLHKFFGHCCVAIDVFDNNGTRHSPREWFQIPYDIIDKAIHLMISGEIVNYKYDRNTKQIVKI